MRKLFLTMLLISAMVLASVGMATAETILFPYIVYNKANGLDTVITVINTNTDSTATHLHYQFHMKSATASGSNTVSCTPDSFVRPTTLNDIVTFAVGGSTILNSGKAMFNDATDYGSGVGAPYFTTIASSPAIGYLVVIPSDGLNDIAANGSHPLTMLDGEASIYDITTGAMWGYRAIPSSAGSNTDYSSNVNLINTTNAPFATPVTYPAPKISFYPHSNFVSRYFVTPATADMIGGNSGSTTVIGHYYRNAVLGALGVFDRNEQFRDGGNTATVRCVGRVDAAALSPALDDISYLKNEGGWAYLGLPAASAPAFIYELKFGSFSSGDMVNDGKMVLPRDMR